MTVLSNTRWVISTTLLAISPLLAATTIDPFTAPQGPFTFGVGEEPTEAQSVVETDSVLGGVRIAGAEVLDEAPANSTAMFQIGDGEWLCELDHPINDPETAGGACGSSYVSRTGQSFDLSTFSSFDFSVIEASGSGAMVVTLIDVDDQRMSAAELNLSSGPLSILREAFFLVGLPDPEQTFDWSNVEVIQFAIGNHGGFDARVRLGGISTTGNIDVGGLGTPTEPEPEFPDEDLTDTISGLYFNPARDGEGCMLTREADQTLFILTCYVYLDGEQAWMIGLGLLQDGRINFGDMVVTRGTGYGENFDPDAVERIPFGDVRISFSTCNEALISMDPIVDGFVAVELPMQRIVPVQCDQGVPSPENALHAGTWFNPLRNGEGFHLAAEGDEDLHILNFYTYLDGEQVWMIGTGIFDGEEIEFGDVVVTRGTGFGPEFSAAEVERIPFGKIIFKFSDCNNAIVRTESLLPQFPDLVTEVTRIVGGPCTL